MYEFFGATIDFQLFQKKDEKWRSYRRLNAVTMQDAYPFSRIDKSLDALAGSRYFSTLNLRSGYWQVPLEEDVPEKSDFVTRSGQEIESASV